MESLNTQPAAGSAPLSTALRLSGRDVLDLLHRIGTQAVLDLGSGQSRATLFCDFRGRLLHRAVVARTGENEAWLFRHDAPGESLAAFLDRQIFRDDVAIEDRSRAVRVRLERAGAGAVPQPFSGRDDATGRIFAAEGWELSIGGAADHAAQVSVLETIRAGLAEHGYEIRDAFTPFEVGLAQDVHLDKGCYPGQEALMRLVTYRGVRRSLMRVAGEGPVPEAPHDLVVAGTRVGVITRAASERDSRWLGLAVVRGDHGEPGATFDLVDGASAKIDHVFAARRALGRP